MTDPVPTPAAPAPPWMCALFVIVGLLIMGVGLHATRLNPHAAAPTWVVLSAGGLFSLAGLLMMSQRDPHSLRARLLIAAFFSVFAAVFGWVGLAPGPREFSSSASFVGVTATGHGHVLLGRVLFGGIGILVGVIALGAWHAFARTMLGRLGAALREVSAKNKGKIL
ncbi:MAG: hypothetical protein JO341_09440 [Gammaproteobacteria bacterium]|nr:hypothetical protein [Gammaproteobacteria bacterium]